MFLFSLRQLSLEKQQKSFTPIIYAILCNFFVVIMHFKVESTVFKMYGLKHSNIGTHTQEGEVLSEAYLKPSRISAMELFCGSR